jgi:plasmid maintenance system antidote protein VapI
MNQSELIELLKDVPSPISRIEEKLGMPKSTIQKVIDGNRRLPKEWEIRLRNFVAEKQYQWLKRKPRTVVKNLNKQSTGTTQKVEPIITNNESIDTLPKRFMSDAMKKRLGL